MEYMSDISSVYGTRKVGDQEVTIAKKGSNMDLDMMDFIQLMIVQMTNQGIDDSMDTSEMLNQMVQMQMIQSMVNMTDATVTNYAASLVGKEVTVGKYGDDGKLQEVVGTVTATGTMDGSPVIFVNDEYYYLSEIMAVGRLPEPKKEEDEEGTEGVEGAENTDKPTDSAGASDSSTAPDGSHPVEDVDPSEEAQGYGGEGGTPNDGE